MKNKNMGEIERNGVGSQREMVPKVLTHFFSASLLYMCHEAGYCNKYVLGIN